MSVQDFLISIPPEVYMAATNFVGQQVIDKGKAMISEKEKKDRATKLILEAREWPLSRCVAVFPVVSDGTDGTFQAALLNDGRLTFGLVITWFAPFPAEHMSLDFRCELSAPDNATDPNHHTVIYSVRDFKIEDKQEDGTAWRFLPRTARQETIPFLRPDVPVTIADVGQASPPEDRTRFGRVITIRDMRLTANGLWPCVRDTVKVNDFGFWVPRW